MHATASTVAILALAATAVSAGQSNSHRAQHKSSNQCSLIKFHNQGFDDQTFLPVLPLFNAVNEIGGLQYHNAAGVNTKLLTLDLNVIRAPSAPNVLVTGFEQNLLNGGGLSAGHMTMTTKYAGAVRPFFNLHDFNMACFANTVVSAANIPVDCKVRFKSFRNGKLKGNQQVTYKSGTEIGNVKGNLPLVKANTERFHLEDPNFCDIDTITVTIEGGNVGLPNIETRDEEKRDKIDLSGLPTLPLPSLLVAATFDNLNYTLHC